MAQPSGPNGELAFTLFLQLCVEQGVIPLEVAERLDRFRRSAGPDLLRSLQEIGIAPAAPAAPAAAPAASYAPQLLDGGAHPGLTFDTFVPCRANAFALQVAKAVAGADGTPCPYNPVYIWSDVGMGKTHLLSAIANAAAGRRVLLLNTADLAVEFERARRMQAEADLCQYVMAADLLLLDDIQLCAGDEALQRGLFVFLDHLERRQRVVVVSAAAAPAELRGVESRLLSRLQSGVTVQLQPAEPAERAEIVRRAVGAGALSKEIIGRLADRHADSVRGLIAAARQLLAQQELTGAAAAVPEAAEPEPAAPSAEEPDSDPTPWAARFKGMLTAAQTEDEQAMALQMAVAERLRQLRKEGAAPELVRRFTEALDLLSAGRSKDAVQRIFM
jgi:chromosomal replication initiation ATPase DnaA